MTLDEFLALAPMTLQLFAMRTRERAQTDESMNPNTHRDEAWWWRDVAAMLDYTELEERLRREGHLK